MIFSQSKGANVLDDNEDKPCEICGDIGYADVIRVCSQCRITSEHAYCMRIVHEGDPGKWACDECKSVFQIPLPKPVSSKQLEDTKTRFKVNKPPPNSKVQYITTEEAMVLGSVATRSNSSPSKIPKRDPTVFQFLPPRFSVKPNHQIGPPGFTKSLNDRRMPSNSRDKTLSTSKGAHVCTDAQPKSIDPEGRESSKVTMLDKFLPNHPAEFSTWKGSFKVTGDVVPCGFCDGVQAHPPTKVHSKVYEFSKQLPTMLQFELLPRLNLWVDVFEEVVPGGLDIGLYFLPSMRHEQSYTCLVEYLGQCDVLLRSCINDIELLIFSSKHLQEDSQRMNQNYFLWGVFRFMGDNMVGENRAVSPEDMEIDMMGGHDMGNVDVVIPKPAEEGRVDPMKGEVTALPKRPTDSILEFSPSEVELGSLRRTSCLKDELFFERELRRSFDRFDAVMKQREAASAVKVEKSYVEVKGNYDS